MATSTIDTLRFEPAGNEMRGSLILIVLGLVLTVVGVFLNMDNLHHVWTSVMYNNLFFLFIGLCATFFIAANSVGYGGWYLTFRRILEAMMGYVPVGAVLLAITLLLGTTYIYHWTDQTLYDPSGHHYDKILADKQAYLNIPFFALRSAIYLGMWSLFAFLLRRNSLQSDQLFDLGVYQRSKYIAGAYIVFFAVTSSTCSWDYLMSIQPHWYSTLWGWYTFISMFVTTMSVTYLICVYLKRRGYLPYMTEEHFHDIGKFMFAFSVAWAYLFFDQYMLIWYANLPEETVYFKLRMSQYPLTMYVMFICGFVAPFFVLITRGNKRNWTVSCLLACVIIFAHWLDFFQMSVPGAIANNAGHGAEGHAVHFTKLGILEIGLLLTLTGIAMQVFFRGLARAPLLPINHPFVKESILHHT